MIALDLDGTLALEDHRVSPATRDALEDLHENGVEVVIATGRRYRTTRYVIDNLGFDVFAVCNGGALVKNPAQQTMHREVFDVTPLTQMTRDLGLTLFAQRDAHELGGADFVMDTGVTWDDISQRHHEKNKAFSERADLANSPPEFVICGTFGAEPACRQLAANINETFGDEYNTIVVPHLKTGYFYCEIALGHVDKWLGLSKVRTHLDIDAAHTCTVGDQLNDMAMVTSAGHGVSMSNGHSDLKAAADFICGHNETDGILDVVAYIKDINRRAP